MAADRTHTADPAAATTTSVPAASSPAPRGGAPGTATGWPVLRWVLRQQRRTLLGWAVAMAAVSAIYVSLYPLIGDSGELEALIEGLPEGLVIAMGYDRIGSAAGYLESTVYALLGPILLLVFAVATGARLIADAEEAGELELESAAPISRVRVLLERYTALAVSIALLAAVTGLVSALLVTTLDMDVALGPLSGATVGLALLVLAHGTVAFAVGAATGRRAWALGVGAGFAVAAFMANALGPMLEDGAWLERASTFWWYLGNDPLVEGLALAGSLALLALTGVALALAVVVYDRRDLGV
ncbi:MAG: ABC transporter permease subunit [Nitriliruptoraceae bacterium]